MSNNKIAIKNSLIALSAATAGTLLVLLGIANRGIPSDKTKDLESTRAALENNVKNYSTTRDMLIKEAKTFSDNEDFITTYLNCDENLAYLEAKTVQLNARIAKLQKDSTKRAEMLKTPFMERFKANNRVLHQQIKDRINGNKR